MFDTIINLSMPILATFAVTLVLTPVVKIIANHVGALDNPNARKVHTKITPRLGGLAIFLGFLTGFMMYAPQNTVMISILIASFVLVLTGLIDDIKPLPAKYKFSGQIIAALIITVYGGIILEHITIFDYIIDFGWFAYPLTIFFILGAINCINLIDGLDGLSAGVSTIFFGTIAVLAILIGGRIYSLDVVLALIMFGALLGFLVYNFYPASIFMGDTGSMFVGLIIAVIALLGYKNFTFTSLIIPLLLLAIPILDTLLAIIRRSIKGEGITKADKYHIHHRILALTNSHRKTVLIIYGICLLFAASSVFYTLRDGRLGLVVYGVLIVIVLWLILITTILKDKKAKTDKL